MSRSGIICGGNFIVDRVKVIDKYPPEQTLALISKESNQNGGSAFNVLIDLSRLGFLAPLAGIGLVGDDDDGHFVLSECRTRSIDTRQIRSVAHESTSYTDVMTVGSTGKRTFFHHPGANAKLCPEDFDFSETTCRHFHLGYLLLLDELDRSDAEYGTGAARVLAAAKTAGLSTSVDVVSAAEDRFQSVVLPTLPYVDVCFMNEFELSKTTATPIGVDSGQQDLDKACKGLFEAGLQELAIIHSARWGYAMAKSGESWMSPSREIPASEIRSSVGAGDAFAAGFLFGLHEEKPIEECLRWAIVAGACCLRGLGASDGLQSLGDII